MAKPVMPPGAAVITTEYALSIPQDVRQELVKWFCGEPMLFDDYCAVQKSICDRLRQLNPEIPAYYWHSYELTPYDDGRVVARKRAYELMEVDGEDGGRKTVVTKVAKFSYAGQFGLDGRRNGRYDDADRLIAQDLACEPEVKEVDAWVADPE